MKIPRVLLTAGSSGSGKTLVTCGLLQALINRGKKPASFKCGPDYIDPMFHTRVIGAPSRNLDTFFTGEKRTAYLLAKNFAGCDIAVMEGVMGYYDGVGGISVQASAYSLAKATDTPVILIVNSKGMSVSLAAYVKGFLEYKKDSRIQGIILNQMSSMLYPRMKKVLENELGVKVLGYVPPVQDCVIESRHLGLVLPEEIQGLKQRLIKLAGILEETLDIGEIIRMAESAPEIMPPESLEEEDKAFSFSLKEKVKIGVASDEAFCFFYQDNFRILEKMGAEFVWFSPIHDKQLPKGLDGLLLYGGYPELHASRLEQNGQMRREIAGAIQNGMPCMAECGGFMYLHEEMEGMDGRLYKMAGAIKGKAFRTKKLCRFGYITLRQNGPGKKILGETGLGEIPAHEFHYFDSENCGEDFYAEKPLGSRGWPCIHGNEALLAGFPHLYYYANPKIPKAFLKKCREYADKKRKPCQMEEL